MRPLRLELEGFTVYKKPQTIDFEKLNFFIIQGKTGAGKTSIVDAITYALYGKVPRYGSSRNTTSMLLSKGSKKLRVTLEFSVNGRKFRIERFYRETPREDILRVEEEGKRLNLKKTEVEAWVERITGLDYKTFTKVILLPQGEFDRFLKPSSPRERREILINLLNLEVFERVRQLASESYKSLEGKAEALRKELQTLQISQEHIDTLKTQERALKEKLKQLSLELDKLEKDLSLAQRKEELQKELRNLVEELRELEQEESIIEDKRNNLSFARRVAPYLPLLDRLEEIFKEIRTLNLDREKLLKDKIEVEYEMQNTRKEAEKVESKFSKLSVKREELSSLKAEREKLRVALEEVGKLDSEKQHIKELEALLKKQEDKLRECEERLKKGEKLIIEVKEELKSLQFDEKAYRKLMEEVGRKKGLEHALEKLSLLEKEEKRLKEVLESREGELRSLREALSKKEKLVEEESIKYYAYHIANHLKEGDPCPVCGGTFKGFKGKILEKRLSPLKEELEALRESILSLEKEIISLKASLDRLSKEKEAIVSELEANKDLLQKDIERELEHLEKTRKLQQELRDKLQRYTERYNELVIERESVFREVEKTRNEINSRNRFVSEAEKRLVSLIGGYTTGEDIKRRLRALESSIRSLQKEIEQTEAKREEIKSYLDELSKNYIAIDTKLRETENLLRKKEEEKKELVARLAPLYEEFGDIDKVRQFALTEDEIRALEMEIEEFSRRKEFLQKRIKDVNKELEKLRDVHSYEELKNLYLEKKKLHEETARSLGSVQESIDQATKLLERKRNIEAELKDTNKRLLVYGRISEDLRSDRLQDFVASLMLKQVVERASYYLYRFTNQYELEIDSRGELSVIDRVQGGERSVRTLSGGETFLASLSLALGVSDILSSKAHLESLFIDEGFGSLDEETRERVSDILQLVKQNINRMVGIISHIPDLAERFHQRIVVKKHSDYSTIEVIY